MGVIARLLSLAPGLSRHLQRLIKAGIQAQVKPVSIRFKTKNSGFPINRLLMTHILEADYGCC
jgi:hypothetical protein